MTRTQRLNIPLNRVEGDLEIQVEVRDGIVVDAWSAGTMYRGFENILVGRAALDGLVITPRICGICTTAHLSAAAYALDQIAGVGVPDHGRRIRNITQMVEQIQSDARHSFLLFAPDFVNPAYSSQPLFNEAVARYTPFQGSVAKQTIYETKRILEVVAILGGQWPHSSFMAPGGIISRPGADDLMQCLTLLSGYQRWYEESVLGCTLERWNAVRSLADLEIWLDENDSQRNSQVGFFLRFGRAIGLDWVGKGCGRFLSFGSLDLPEDTAIQPLSGQGSQLAPAGFANGVQVQPFDQQHISEHTAYSWFEGEPGGLHPFEGRTRPYASGREGSRYTWAKAPRYRGQPAEVGPLAEMIVSKHPLFVDILRRQGPNVLNRQLARLVRPTTLLPAMKTWMREALTQTGIYYNDPGPIEQGEGFGLVGASRGALGHWVKIDEGLITHYQIITPTAWNGSPRDTDGVRGPWEEALVGVRVRDPENPVEIGHIIRSFDACLVCTVHHVETGVSRKPFILTV